MQAIIEKYLKGEYQFEGKNDIPTINVHKDSLLNILNELKNNKEL